MKRFALIILLCLTATTAVEAQLLYKITGNGLKKPSFIFGTYHFASEKFVDEVPGLRATLIYVDQVCGEVDISSISEDMVLSTVAMPEGVTYEMLLDDEHYAKLNAKLRQRLKVDLSNPQLAASIGSFTPAYLSYVLQLLEPVKIPNLDASKPLDPYFDKYAKMVGMSSLYLETGEFQLELLFCAPMDEQVKELEWWLDNNEKAAPMLIEMVEAYLCQDIKATIKAFNSQLKGGMYSKEWRVRMLDQRNKDWMTQIPGIMADKSTLFYVGVAHLDYGKNSLLRLLRKAGYTVTPLL